MIREVEAFLSPIDLTKREYETLCEIMEGALGEATKTIALKSIVAYLNSFLVFSLVVFNGLKLDVSGHVRELILIQDTVGLVCFMIFLSFKCYRSVYSKALETVKTTHSKSYTLGEECIVLECDEIIGSLFTKLVFKVVFKGCVLVIVNLKEKRVIIEQKKVLKIIKPPMVYEDNEEL